MRLFWEIIIPSFGMIKHDVINMLYYKHWKDEQIYIYIYIYIPYTSVAQKMPKSCRCKIATLGHMMYLMYTELLHVYSNLLANFFVYAYVQYIYIYIYTYICVYIYIYILNTCRVFPTGWMGEASPTSRKLAYPPQKNKNLFSLHQKSISPTK